MAKVSRLEKNLSAARCGLVMFDTLNGYLHPDNPEKVKFLADAISFRICSAFWPARARLA
jgi:hypothetical protein